MAKATKPTTAPLDHEPVKKTGFDLKLSTIKKLKYIDLQEDRFQNELLESILNEYFTRWEKENHKIPVK
jgi:hypothetical protein